MVCGLGCAEPLPPTALFFKNWDVKAASFFFFFLLTSGGVSEKQDYDVAPDLLPGGRLAFFSVLAKDRGPLGEVAANVTKCETWGRCFLHFNALSGHYPPLRHFNLNVEHLHCVRELLRRTSEIELNVKREKTSICLQGED